MNIDTVWGMDILHAWWSLTKFLLTLKSMNLISKSSVVGTYKFVSIVEMSVEGFHVTNGKSLGAASILYLSLLLMMSSSLKLITAIFLDRLCRMLICVVNPAKMRTMDWLQLGYLQKREKHIQSKLCRNFGSYQWVRSLAKEEHSASMDLY